MVVTPSPPLHAYSPCAATGGRMRFPLGEHLDPCVVRLSVCCQCMLLPLCPSVPLYPATHHWPFVVVVSCCSDELRDRSSCSCGCLNTVGSSQHNHEHDHQSLHWIMWVCFAISSHACIHGREMGCVFARKLSISHHNLSIWDDLVSSPLC